MPYSSTSELPPQADKYSPKCKRAFRSAFNSTHARTGSEERSFAAAHAAAKRCMEKKDMDSLPAARFQIFTKDLQATEGENGKMRFKTVASSTLTDRQGDRFTEKALASMAQSAMGMNLWLNHKYQVPEDFVGTVYATEIRKINIEKDGVSVPGADLLLETEVDENNDRAVRMWKSINKGTRFGCSIGALVKQGTRDEEGVYVIDEVDLLEASIIGIPAQPRAWVEYAVKSLNSPEADVEDDEVVMSGPVAPTLLVEKIAETEPPAEEAAEAPEPEAAEEAAPVEEPAAEPAEEAEPTESDQEAPAESDPESADEGASKSMDDDSEANLPVLRGFANVAEMLQKTTSELIATRKQLHDSEEARLQLANDLETSTANLAIAVEIVEKIAQLPIGSRASHREAINDFRQTLKGVYDEDFLKLLTSGEDNG